MAEIREEIRRIKARLPTFATKKEMRDLQAIVVGRIVILETGIAQLAESDKAQNEMLEKLVEGDAVVMREQIAQGAFLRDFKSDLMKELAFLRQTKELEE